MTGKGIASKGTSGICGEQQVEFQLLAERLLNIVGGTCGKERDNDNHVLIGVGLGKFSSRSGLSSLHSSFLSFFIPLISIS